MNNFWQSTQKPIIALAPMEDVTDTVFREVLLSISEPGTLNVVFTEFTSTDGMCNDWGRTKVSRRLQVNDTERAILKARNIPLVAQIWGSSPEKFAKTAAMITEMQRFDGIDINMGCPVEKVVKKQCCAALINNPALASEIIMATVESTPLPVSVKTRIGFNSIVTESWISHLLESPLSAIILHGRTQKMKSEGLALWDEIGKAVRLRNESGKDIVMLGNGDVDSLALAHSHMQNHGVDGVMVGTGVFKNPWMFNHHNSEADMLQRMDLLQKHIELYESTWGRQKDYAMLKRFYKIYLNSFPGAAEWRDKLMHSTDHAQALAIIEELRLADIVMP